MYERLLERQGHSDWWPGESAFEVCVGAILTQNTAWTNVEKAREIGKGRAQLAAIGKRDPEMLIVDANGDGDWVSSRNAHARLS